MNIEPKFRCYKNRGCINIEHETLISIHYWDDDTIFIEDKEYPLSEIPACIINALNENKEADEERKVIFSIVLDDVSFDHESAVLDLYDCEIKYIEINETHIKKADIPKPISNYIEDLITNSDGMIKKLLEKLKD